MTKRTTYALVSVLMMAACKPAAQTADIKSLDNFVGASSRTNVCKADPGLKLDKKDYPMTENIRFLGNDANDLKLPLTTALENALANVPSEIHQLFVSAGGKVVVADDAAGMCAALTKETGSSTDSLEQNSCIAFIAKTDDNEQILHLVLPPDPVNVQHNIVRLAAMFVIDVLPLADDARKDLVSGFMANASSALIRDLVQSKALNGSDILTGKLGPRMAQRLVAAAKDGSLTASAFNKAVSGFSAADAERFSEFSRSAFVESFDSFYCNSWEAATSADVLAIRGGNFARINLIRNTRAVMAALFPESHKLYKSFASGFLSALKKKSGKVEKAASFSLAGGQPVQWDINGDGRYNVFERGSSAVATFGKSLFWDQTTKPVSQAYGRYSDRVVRNWNNGSGVVDGYFKGASDQYKQEVAQPVRDRTEAVFDRQVSGGATVNQAYRNTLAVELLRPTGTTAVVESTVLGERFDGSQYKDGFERASEFSFGVSGMASTAAVPLSFMPRGTLPAAPGVAPTSAEIAANQSALETIGLSSERALKYAPAFEGGAEVTTIPKGTSLYRYGEGPGSWVSRTPVRDPLNSLALPGEKVAPVSRFVTTQEIKAVEGVVSPQPQWANPGNPKLGGAGQIYINREVATSGALKPVTLKTPLEQAVIPAAGATTTAGSAKQ